MNGDETCTCGHVAEEHRLDSKGVHECEIEDCYCICFEESDEEESDE